MGDFMKKKKKQTPVLKSGEINSDLVKEAYNDDATVIVYVNSVCSCEYILHKEIKKKKSMNLSCDT